MREGPPVERCAGCERHRNDVMRRWRDHSNYYALLEIVETRLEDGLGTMSMQSVVDLLGTQHIDWEYPNSRREGFLVWSSDRALPMGSYLVVRFDGSGVAQSYEWVSE